MHGWGIARRRRKRYTESNFANRISSMTRDEIIAMIRKNAEAIKAEGVTKLAIFGSRVRGDNRADSDLDVLVEVGPAASFSILNLIGVQHIIEDATGLQAQATMRRSIPPRFAERIADDIFEVFLGAADRRRAHIASFPGWP